MPNVNFCSLFKNESKRQPHLIFLLIVFLIKISFVFGLDSSGLDNDNAESGIGTATPPKEQVCFEFILYTYAGFLMRKKTYILKSHLMNCFLHAKKKINIKTMIFV